MRVRDALLVFALVAASPLQAQTREADCDASTVQAQPAASVDAGWRALHPNAVLERFAPAVEAGAWEAVFERFRAQIAAEPHLTPPLRARLLRQFDALDSSRVAAQPFNRQRFVIDRFVPAGEDEEAFVLFPATADAIALSDSMNADARRAVCWIAIATTALVTRYGEADRAVAVAALGRTVRQWDRFNAVGYSMYPWELAVNSRGSGRLSLVPPRRQVVLLHPSVSFGVRGGSLETLRRQDVAALEVAGLLVYNEARSWYGGASLLVTLPTEGGPGVGGLVHLSPTLRGGYVLQFDDGSAGGFVVSLDLYNLLTGVPARYRAARQRVAEMRDAAPPPHQP